MHKAISVLSAVLLSSIIISGAAFCQPMQKQYVADFGGAFTQATVTKARMGFLGLDIHAGKMLMNNLSVGLATGCDVVSFRKFEGIYERLGVVPVLAKARYYFNVAPMMQAYASVAGGVYQTIPHLTVDPIGNVWKAVAKGGGSAGVGFYYWFMGTQGVGAEFEYNFFETGGSELFSYFAVRVNYSIIKM